MNRFKVKAKLAEGDLSGNRWVHGYYVFLNNKHCIITEQGGLSYPEQVNPNTICRCLDRFDIHGELIYENDHIRSGEVVGNHLDDQKVKEIHQYVLYYLGIGNKKWYLRITPNNLFTRKVCEDESDAHKFLTRQGAENYNWKKLNGDFAVERVQNKAIHDTFEIKLNDGKTHSNV